MANTRESFIKALNQNLAPGNFEVVMMMDWQWRQQSFVAFHGNGGDVLEPIRESDLTVSDIGKSVKEAIHRIQERCTRAYAL